MKVLRIKLWIFFIVHFSISLSQEIETSREKFSLGNFFNDTTISLLKVLIKEIYGPPVPSEHILVQADSKLCKEEKNFLHNRLPIVQNNLKEFFNIDQPLRIGFCCSGGGNRSMIGTLGLLTGAAKSHVLDATLYLAGLSGSTWLISQFCYLAATSYKKQPFEVILSDIKRSYAKMLHDYSMLHINSVYAPPLISFESTDDVCIEIAKRFAYEQPMTLVNLFGALVGDYALSLMGNDRLSEKWSRINTSIQKGAVPLPLCSAVFEKTQAERYGWFEMSPLQCGSKDLGYIPVEYLGSEFYNGALDINNICPEYPLSFYLGMYGSAFAVTVQDIAHVQKALHRKVTLLKEDENIDLQNRNILESHIIKDIIQGTIKDIIFSRNVLTYARFPNFSKNVKHSVLRNDDFLGLFDAGVALDFPLPLLIDRPERNLDVIFLYGSFPGSQKTLQALANYCRQQNILFPEVSSISDQELQQDDMTILNNPMDFAYKPDVPTYIYFPTNNIDIYTAPYITLNFRYSANDVYAFSGKMEQIFLDNIDKIKEVLRLVAQKRYGV